MAQLWFKKYASDYLVDTKVRLLTWEQKGILESLWCLNWKDGSIPSDPGQQSMLLGGGLTAKAMRTHSVWIANFFIPHPEDSFKLISPRMEIDRAECESKGAKARESALTRWNHHNANASPKAHANASKTHEPTQCVQDASQSTELEKDNLPNGSANADPRSKPKRPRRTREEILQPFSPDVKRVVNTLGPTWRKEDPADGRKITVDPFTFGQRVSEILEKHREVTPDLLIQAGEAYCQSQRSRYKAPQFFFGPGQGSEGSPCIGFLRALLAGAAS